jgi:glycoside/pentoside/hexuronide:cation symporter, GPH family
VSKAPRQPSAILYGLPYLVFSIAQLPIAIFIPAYYSSELGVPLALTGLIIALTRVSDVITDPLVGILSDRTKGRFGRRKPWIAAGVPLLMLSAWMLYAPPEGAGAWHLGLWMALIYLAFTFIDIPLKAWGAELSQDYARRSVITGWREVFGQIGVLVALGYAAYLSISKTGDTGDAMRGMAIGVAIGAPILFALALAFVPEPPRDGYARETPIGWKRGLKIVVRNGPFIRLTVCAVALVTATFIGTTLNQLYVQHVLKAPDVFAPTLFASLLVSVLCAPAWIWVSNRIGKHKAVAIAAAWASLVQLPFAFLGEGDAAIFVGLTLLGGTASAAISVLVNSMAADVIDLDVARTGESRSGLYFSTWGMAIKSSVAIAVLVATAIPSAFGFQADGSAQSAAGVTALAWTYALLPAGIVALTFPALWRYPITPERQRRLRAAIDRRAARSAASPG